MTPTSKPNKAETAWREWVRDQGCVLGMPGPVEIHHVAGRTAKHLGVPIGHWFILPVSNGAHRIVERMPKIEQKDLFRFLVCRYLELMYESPFSADVALGIWDWHR